MTPTVTRADFAAAIEEGIVWASWYLTGAQVARLRNVAATATVCDVGCYENCPIEQALGSDEWGPLPATAFEDAFDTIMRSHIGGEEYHGEVRIVDR